MQAWAVHPIEAPHQVRDPLVHPRPSKPKGALRALRLLAAAALLHGLVLSTFLLAQRVAFKSPRERATDRVAVRIVEPEPPPPPPPPPPAEVAPEAPQVEPAPPPKPKPRKKRPTPPPDPITPPPAPPEQQEPARRRVVGLDLSSTVAGGEGPAFATGSTRMGQTASQAENPEQAKRVPAQEHNQAASRLPIGNQPVVRPQRLQTPTPIYPPLLREQGIEADVVLVVTIDAGGHVREVRVIRPASEPAFNEAAVRAARQSRWAPATRGGQPFETTQRYTIRFRLND